MTGWLILIFMIATALAFVRLLGARGAMLQMSAAALLFGAAGYAFQGRPGLSGTTATTREGVAGLQLTEARHAFFGSFSPEESWMRFSEGLARAGKSEDAVGILTNAVRRYPGSAHLWIGLGNALVDHAGGITPPAEFAYRRAAELGPDQPAPKFFYGLALARSGDRAAAIALWREILETAPSGASWRPLIEGGVEALSKPPPAG